MQHTTNYNLNQWEAGDRVTRADFNADNAKIDAALKAHDTVLASCARVMFGTYNGDYREPRTINLGFTPKAVILWGNGYMQQTNQGIYGGVAFADHPCEGLVIVDGGFQVRYVANTLLTNGGSVYYYIAFY